jgi:hypothetical protein
MTEANKNVFKDLGKAAIGLGIFIAIAYLVPDDSIFKQIFMYICIALLFASFLIFTPLGNPIKKLIRKYQDKKKANGSK